MVGFRSRWMVSLTVLIAALAGIARAAGPAFDLGTLGGAFSAATGVNATGQVIGISNTADGAQHAFSWTAAGGMVDLGTLGGTVSSPSGVTASGQVAGQATRPAMSRSMPSCGRRQTG
jgi:probable HAF family extracellular repeat protein